MSKKLPDAVKFFIADDIRIDAPKPMLIGFFPDDAIAIDLGDQEAPSIDNPISISSLAFMATFINCSGTFRATVGLYQPDNTPMIEQREIAEPIVIDPKQNQRNANFVGKFTPFVVTELGTYTLVISLDEHEYKYNFTISKK